MGEGAFIGIVLVVAFKILLRLATNKVDTGSALHFAKDGYNPLSFGKNQPRPCETIDEYYARMDEPGWFGRPLADPIRAEAEAGWNDVPPRPLKINPNPIRRYRDYGEESLNALSEKGGHGS